MQIFFFIANFLFLSLVYNFPLPHSNVINQEVLDFEAEENEKRATIHNQIQNQKYNQKEYSSKAFLSSKPKKSNFIKKFDSNTDFKGMPSNLTNEHISYDELSPTELEKLSKDDDKLIPEFILKMNSSNTENSFPHEDNFVESSPIPLGQIIKSKMFAQHKINLEEDIEEKQNNTLTNSKVSLPEKENIKENSDKISNYKVSNATKF